MQKPDELTDMSFGVRTQGPRNYDYVGHESPTEKSTFQGSYMVIARVARGQYYQPYSLRAEAMQSTTETIADISTTHELKSARCYFFARLFHVFSNIFIYMFRIYTRFYHMKPFFVTTKHYYVTIYTTMPSTSYLNKEA